MLMPDTVGAMGKLFPLAAQLAKPAPFGRCLTDSSATVRRLNATTRIFYSKFNIQNSKFAPVNRGVKAPGQPAGHQDSTVF